jgi:hypothetical protein
MRQERLQFAQRNMRPTESKSDQCRRQLRDLRAKTNAIKYELDLRHASGTSAYRALLVFWAIIAENVISKQPARSSSAAGAAWGLSTPPSPTNRCVARRAENPEFGWQPLQAPPAFCT